MPPMSNICEHNCDIGTDKEHLNTFLLMFEILSLNLVQNLDHNFVYVGVSLLKGSGGLNIEM